MKGLAMLVHVNDEGETTHYTLEEFDGDADALREVIGGWLEAAPTADSVTLWIDEEGKIKRKPVNRFAMDVWIKYDVYRCMLVGHDWLAGNAVITGGVDAEGNTMDLADTDRAWVQRVAREATS